jgi:hypothetical protein
LHDWVLSNFFDTYQAIINQNTISTEQLIQDNPNTTSLLQANLNKKISKLKTRPLLLIVLIGCAAGSKQLIGLWCQNSNIFVGFLN